MNAVEMKGIRKTFGSVKALSDVDFEVAEGEIHSLLGENGAGKSTLMNILYGMLKKDAGTVKIKGKEAQIRHPSEAIRQGIGMVHQHFMLTPVMTVTENVIVGTEPVRGPFIDYASAGKRVQALIDQYHFGIDAGRRISELSVGEQQRVEIIKALYRGADILILDEPTAVLTPQEVEHLFAVLKELKRAGKSIIIITHKLKETSAVADRVSVLRQGRMIDTGIPTRDCSINDLALMMVGRKVDLEFTRRSQSTGGVAYEVRDLRYSRNGVAILNGISFSVRRGEIYGIAGIEGNGQTELIEALTGLIRPDRMELFKDGRPLAGAPADFLRAGVGHIPEDRQARGLITPMSIEENLILGYHRGERFGARGIFDLKKIRKFSAEMLSEYAVKAAGPEAPVKSLSGGNQQKVVIARVFSEDPDILIAAQPTRGVDVGAQEFIHNKLFEIRDQGKAIILISADLDEVRRLSDRIGVIYDGRIVAEGAYDRWDEMELGLLMTGSAEQEGEPA